MTQTKTKKVTEMSEAEFAAHLAEKHAALDLVEVGVNGLKKDYDLIERRLAGRQPN